MKIKLLMGFIMLLSQHAMSNNVQVSNVRLTGQNTTDDFTMVEFDISWENSWRYTNGPANWDAAWIFVKYRVGTGGEWKHAFLNNSGHFNCASTTIAPGLLMPGVAYHSTTNPVMGVFLYRSQPGVGNLTCQDMQLRWNYGSNNIPDNATIDIRVFALECVYIPEGSFKVGTGGTEENAFYTYPSLTTPFAINSENAITVAPSSANLYYSNISCGGDQLGPIPAIYPKGYKAFYVMKYEISQQSYVDFLNTLTRIQQQSKVFVDISGQTITNRFVMSNTTFPASRCGISCRNNIPPPPGQVEFFCDLNSNTIGSESSDGLNIACNYLAYDEVAAFLDWASFRLMTEFEYEKCGRGPVDPYPEEYAWGNAVYNRHNGVTNSGFPNETPIDPIANVTSIFDDGPLRCGVFARNMSDRVNAGAGYYGCMELSTNLQERGVSVGSPEGRSYTGEHGNGLLSASGFADVTLWPSTSTAVGTFLRGTSYGDSSPRARLSDRKFAGCADAGASGSFGGRGVRTAP